MYILHATNLILGKLTLDLLDTRSIAAPPVLFVERHLVVECVVDGYIRALISNEFMLHQQWKKTEWAGLPGFILGCVTCQK